MKMSMFIWKYGSTINYNTFIATQLQQNMFVLLLCNLLPRADNVIQLHDFIYAIMVLNMTKLIRGVALSRSYQSSARILHTHDSCVK